MVADNPPLCRVLIHSLIHTVKRRGGETDPSQDAVLATLIDTFFPDDITLALSALQTVFGCLSKYLDGVAGISNELSNLHSFTSSMWQDIDFALLQIHYIAKAIVVAMSVPYKVCIITTFSL